jgi:hypothetical protein
MVSQKKKNTPAANSHDRHASDKPAEKEAAGPGSRDRRPSDKVAAQRMSVFLNVKKRMIAIFYS